MSEERSFFTGAIRDVARNNVAPGIARKIEEGARDAGVRTPTERGDNREFGGDFAHGSRAVGESARRGRLKAEA